jgi:glycosyltransferase involved in cell wall biosynthesis
MVRRLSMFTDVMVFCLLPRYPKFFQPRSFDHRDVNPNFRLPDVSVRYIKFPAIPILSRAVNGMVCARYLLKEIRPFMPDVILNYWVYPQGYAAVHVGAKLGVPTVVGAIGSDLNSIEDPMTRFFTRLTLKRAAAVVTKSNHLRQQAVSLGATALKVHAVLNGCDTSVFRVSSREQARCELQLDPTERLIVYVGRLELDKGLLELIEAFASLRRLGKKVNLAIIGDGTRRELVEAKADELGVADWTRFIGRQTSLGVSRWLAASDLLALPSYAEGCPNVILEAICCGRPVVASNVGGIPEVVNQHCAVLVPPHDVEALTAALDVALAREWDEIGIAKQFGRSWQDMAVELYDICLSVLPNQTFQNFAPATHR